MLNTIFLITGQSGSGKTTLCDQLRTISKLCALESYTTRKPRYDGERGHIFVDSFQSWTEANKDAVIVGYTFFDGNYYWATSQQINDNDLYVIDPKGVEFFLSKYDCKKNAKIIYVDASLRERFKRMLQRGDSVLTAIKRIWNDAFEFKGWKRKADFVVKNHNLTEGFMALDNYINHFKSVPNGECEKYGTLECLKCDYGYTDDEAIYCGKDL